MRDYLKPSIEDETIEIEDVVIASPGGLTKNGVYDPSGSDTEEEFQG